MRRSGAAALSVLAASLFAVTGCTDDDKGPAPTAATVIASTTWVGALAKAAGADDVAVIAPANIPDPAGFAPTDEELAPAAKAEHVVYAETDGFAAALRGAAGKAHLVPVKPAVTLPQIRAEVTRLGKEFGTEAAAARWLATFESQVSGMSDALRGMAPIPAFKAVAAADVAQWAPFAGVEVVATYGPGPATGPKLAALVARKPKLLLASVHHPNDVPRIPGAIRVDLVNYPGADLDLLAVYQTNGDRISGTFAK
jgi:zinc transport system substrate-binding protein